MDKFYIILMFLIIVSLSILNYFIKKMEYLNQTIVYLSQENKELKEKNTKI
jgi:cell division protein FtsB